MSLEKRDVALKRFMESINQLSGRICGNDDSEIQFLRHLFQRRELLSLIRLHQTMAQKSQKPLQPVYGDAIDIALLICEDFRAKNGSLSKLCEQLITILANPHIQALLLAHDQIANKEFQPELPDLESSCSGAFATSTMETTESNGNTEDHLAECEQANDLVQLIKSKEPLGATIRVDDTTGRIYIARVMLGGAAHRSGLIRAGDEVKEINSVRVEGKDPKDIIAILTTVSGSITLKLVPCDSSSSDDVGTSIAGSELQEGQVRLRACFSYTPDLDPLIPCREAGLSFRKGDILQLVSRDDADWWQARKERSHLSIDGYYEYDSINNQSMCSQCLTMGEEFCWKCEKADVRTTRPERAGLVPSVTQLKSRQRQALEQRDGGVAVDASTFCFAFSATVSADGFQPSALYEEVVQCRLAGNYRPLCLIGADAALIAELIEQLSEADQCYKRILPYATSMNRGDKPPSNASGNQDAPLITARSRSQVTWIAKERFDELFRENKFLEVWQDELASTTNGNTDKLLCGIAAKQIQQPTSQGSIALVTCSAHTLPLLRSAEMKAFVVLVKPSLIFEPLQRCAAATKNIDSSTSDDVDSISSGDEFPAPTSTKTKINDSTERYSEQLVSDLLRETQQIEDDYAHLVDLTVHYVITMTGDKQYLYQPDVLLKDLYLAGELLKRKPQWVPKSWLSNEHS